MNLNWQQSVGIDQSHLIDFKQFQQSNVLVHKDIITDLENLLLAAKSDNVVIEIVSCYRSFDRQLSIWNGKWQGHRPVTSRHGRPLNIAQMSDMEKYKAISLWSALPGFSRHHWGTDMDIFCRSAIQAGHKIELVPEEFSNKGVCHPLNNWLDNNLEQYNFFRPYQNYQRGVSEEPWHISHQPTSQQIMNNYPFEQCQDYLNQSDIKSRAFMSDMFEHYKTQYFLNICEYGQGK